MIGWMKIKGAAQYAGISVRTLRGWLKSGLRHSRLPSKSILIKIAWLDEFLEGFEIDTDKAKREINDAVDEVLRDF